MATFLLVHGGFCRSWVWGDTATALAARGHRVEAVDLPTSGPDPSALGLQDDVDAVRRALDAPGSGAVLVGHSAGGMVLAELADHPAVQHSVYVAALRPERGQSAADMLGGQIPGWMVVCPEEGVVRVSDSPAVVRRALCADVEESRFSRDVYPRFVPSSLQVLAGTSSAPTPGHGTTYVICEEDQAVPVAAQQAMSARSDRVERLPSSHNPMLSMPERLAQVLETAAPGGTDDEPS
ncbi:alpha/beta fold hydrolase [Geodermatophilus chilensis]|uniref:alpha/beta fold hydrolase n=1 Tax=Geodermatophilus chilensis TaxID=2035835 RepID=UPI000C25DF15|nr:alpha/beta hydrolase [Geodermatophilus chilensis]